MFDLKHYRTRLGLTQEAVAKKINISRPGYTMIEIGRRRPSPDIAKRIAEVLGFPDEWYRLLETKVKKTASTDKNKRRSRRQIK